MFSHLLFDLDGTLSNPLVGIGQSINYALVAHGFEARGLDVLAECVGPPLDPEFQTLTGVDDAEHIMAMVMKYRERYLDIGYAENTLYPGVVDTLRQLQRHNVNMALCTSKPEPGTR